MALHGVEDIWDAHSSSEDWGFLLVDAKNAFNVMNQIGILLTIRHLWPSLYSFVLNYYCH